MKIYAIYDKDISREKPIGYLFCYEKAKEYIIELEEWLDEWQAPILFQNLVKKGVYTIPKDIALLWVRERVIPSGRQNIGAILKNARLKEYDEMALLAISKGVCSQDNCYLRGISEEELPENILLRREKLIMECYPTEDKKIICMFYDNTVRKLDLSLLELNHQDIQFVCSNDNLFNSVKVGIGGYSISFDNSVEINLDVVREKGILLPITVNDIFGFAEKNILDTGFVCDMLKCSRQNISYLVKVGRMKPIINGTKEKMYTKGAVQRVLNE